MPLKLNCLQKTYSFATHIFVLFLFINADRNELATHPPGNSISFPDQELSPEQPRGEDWTGHSEKLELVV